jgi:hypothetical protein
VTASLTTCTANTGTGATLTLGLSHGDYLDTSASAQIKSGPLSAQYLIATGASGVAQLSFTNAAGGSNQTAFVATGNTVATIACTALDVLAVGVTSPDFLCLDNTGSLGIKGTYNGIGSGLTLLNGSNLASGTVPLARLPTIPSTQITGVIDTSATAQTKSGPLTVGQLIYGSATVSAGAGQGLIGTDGTNPLFRPGTGGTQIHIQSPGGTEWATFSSSGVNATHVGDGSALTNLNASNVTAGTVPLARLPFADPTNASNLASGTVPSARLSFGNVQQTGCNIIDTATSCTATISGFTSTPTCVGSESSGLVVSHARTTAVGLQVQANNSTTFSATVTSAPGTGNAVPVNGVCVGS